MYRCKFCGLVYFFLPDEGAARSDDDDFPPACRGCKSVNGWQRVQIRATARASEYSEAGGSITGIDVSVDVDLEIVE